MDRPRRSAYHNCGEVTSFSGCTHVSGHNLESLHELLVGPVQPEAMSAILGEGTQDDERTDLSMRVAILQLLPDSTTRLRGTLWALEVHTLDQLGDTVERCRVVPVRTEDLDPVRDG